MSEILQPSAGQTVITTDRHHDHHGHHGHHGHFDATETRVDANFRAQTAQGERLGIAGAALAARTNEIVQAGSCRTDSVVQSGFGDTADRLNAGFTAGALAECKTQDAVADVKFVGMETAKDNLIAMNVGFAAGQNGVNTGFAAQSVLSTTIGNATQVLINAVGNQLGNQATANYNGLTVLGERIRAELGAKQDAGFAAATLVAFQNKADSDAKAAKCCCDAEMTAARNFAALSAQITADGNTTRALVTQNVIDDLRAFKASIPRGVAVTLPVGLG